MALTATDWLLLAVILASALLGLFRGFIGVLASLAAWVLAAWAAFRFGAPVRPSRGPTAMINDQHPLPSGFTAASTSTDVLAGLDLGHPGRRSRRPDEGVGPAGPGRSRR